MSVQAMTAVLEHSQATPTTRLVLLTIANYQGDAGAWPSIDTLAKNCGMSRRGVQDAIRRAERAGELSVVPNAGPRGTNVYTILVGPPAVDNPGQDGDKGGAESARVQPSGGYLHTNPRNGSEGSTEVTRSNTAAPDGAAVDNGKSFHVPDRWPYFVQKLRQSDPAWNAITIGALVKIAQATDVEAVSTALSFAAVHAPILNDSAYGWLMATAKGLAASREGGASCVGS